jgi:DNA-binding transcriptional LysR family regulator
MARISLDQWKAVLAVVDAGSYAAAAQVVHKTQSSVSYAVARIESGLDVNLFEIQGRRAVLTAAGEILCRRARHLVEEAARVEQTAARLAAGYEAELRLAVEIVYPTWRLLERLATFAEEHPDTQVEIYESVLGGTDELLLSGEVDLAVCTHVPPGFLGEMLTPVKFVAVAAPTHPLHHLNRTLTREDLRLHRHLLIRDSGSSRSRTVAWQGAQTRWTLSHKASSIRAACMGLGFAWYPEDVIREELASGQLEPLPLAQGAARAGALYLVLADPDGAGPCTLRLAELLRTT